MQKFNEEYSIDRERARFAEVYQNEDQLEWKPRKNKNGGNTQQGETQSTFNFHVLAFFCAVILLVYLEYDGYVSKASYDQGQRQRQNDQDVEEFLYDA